MRKRNRSKSSPRRWGLFRQLRKGDISLKEAEESQESQQEVDLVFEAKESMLDFTTPIRHETVEIDEEESLNKSSPSGYLYSGPVDVDSVTVSSVDELSNHSKRIYSLYEKEPEDFLPEMDDLFSALMPSPFVKSDKNLNATGRMPSILSNATTAVAGTTSRERIEPTTAPVDKIDTSLVTNLSMTNSLLDESIDRDNKISESRSPQRDLPPIDPPKQDANTAEDSEELPDHDRQTTTGWASWPDINLNDFQWHRQDSTNPSVSFHRGVSFNSQTRGRSNFSRETATTTTTQSSGYSSVFSFSSKSNRRSRSSDEGSCRSSTRSTRSISLSPQRFRAVSDQPKLNASPRSITQPKPKLSPRSILRKNAISPRPKRLRSIEETSSSSSTSFYVEPIEPPCMLRQKHAIPEKKMPKELKKQPSLGRREKQSIIRESNPSLYLYEDDPSDWDSGSAAGHLAVYDMDSAISAAVMQCGTCDNVKCVDASCDILDPQAEMHQERIPGLSPTSTEGSDSSDESSTFKFESKPATKSRITAGGKKAFLKRLYQISTDEQITKRDADYSITQPPSLSKPRFRKMKNPLKSRHDKSSDQLEAGDSFLKSVRDTSPKRRTSVGTPTRPLRSNSPSKTRYASDRSLLTKTSGSKNSSTNGPGSKSSMSKKVPLEGDAASLTNRTETTCSLDPKETSSWTSTMQNFEVSSKQTPKARTGISKWKEKLKAIHVVESKKDNMSDISPSIVTKTSNSLTEGPAPSAPSFDNIEVSPGVPKEDGEQELNLKTETNTVQYGNQVFAGLGSVFEEAYANNFVGHILRNHEFNSDEDTDTQGDTTQGDTTVDDGDTVSTLNSMPMSVRGQMQLLQQDLLAFWEAPTATVTELRKDIKKSFLGKA